jgi:hypothetical protein
MSEPLPPTNAERVERQSPGVPGWVKGLGLALVVLVVVLVVVMAAGIGGDHGPGRH